MSKGLPFRVVIGLSLVYCGLLVLLDMLAPSLGVTVPALIKSTAQNIGLPFLFINNIVIFSLMLHKSRQIPFAVDQIKYTIGAPFLLGFLWVIIAPFFIHNDMVMFIVLAVVVSGMTFLMVGGAGVGGGRETHQRGAKLGWGNTSQKAVDDGALTVGGMPLSRQSEVQHALITGSTGTGKTQIMDGFLRTIRKRGDKAVIIDPGGGFYSRHWSGNGGDVILNPLDSRSVAWSPFAEIEVDYDFERVAAAQVPEASGESAQWHVYGRQMVADTMRGMKARKQSSPRQLFDWLMVARAERLGELLEGTASAILCQPENAKMLGSVRGVLTPYVGILKHLEDTETPWSVRRFIRAEKKPGVDDWLFITYRDDQMSLLRQFVATVADLALLEALSLPEDNSRRLFFFLDEIDSLGRIGQLKDALVKLRKFGGVCVLAVQTLAQLRAVYGPDISRALIGNTATKVILRPGDAETAKAMEAEIGEHEIERVTVSNATGTGSAQTGVFSLGSSHQNKTTTTSTQTVRQSAVMASELQGMPNLRGVLIRPGENHAIIDVPYVKMPRIDDPFVAKLQPAVV